MTSLFIFTLVGFSPIRQSKGLPSANVYEIIDEYDVSFGEKDKNKEFIKLKL